MKSIISTVFLVTLLIFFVGCCERKTHVSQPATDTVTAKGHKTPSEKGKATVAPVKAEPLKLTELLNETLSAASGTQTLTHADEISVTIPGSALDVARRLTVSRAEKGKPVNDFAPAEALFLYDVTLEDKVLFPTDPIILEIKYDPSVLNQEYTAQEQLMAVRWDEENLVWVELYSEIDSSKNSIRIYSDHLCLVGFVVLGGGAIYAATDVAQFVLNDLYYTEHFRIMYSRKMLKESLALNDSSWERLIYPESKAMYPVKRDANRHPSFVQDIGTLLEKAFANFMDEQFPDPTSRTSYWRGEYKVFVTVKIDSYFAQATRAPSYEKISQYIHIPTEYLTDFDSGFSYVTLGHELFHRIQAEYYGVRGFIGTTNFWWLEATAEYAGNRVAWKDKKQFDVFSDKIGVDFLSNSIDSTGTRKSHGWASDKEFEYATAVWIKYLVENDDIKKALKFKDMIEFVANSEPFETLDKYINSVEKMRGLSEYYALFVNYAIFAKDSFLSRFDIATFAGSPAEELAALQSKLEISADDAELEISVAGDGTTAFVNIFTTESRNLRYDEVPLPLKRMFPGDTSKIKVKNGEIIYVVAVNNQKKETTLVVSLNTDGSAKLNRESQSFSLPHFSAQLWAVMIEKIEPDMSEYYEFMARRGNIEKYHPRGISKKLPEILSPTIPAKIKGSEVKAIRSSAFRGMGIKQVMVPDTVLRIERTAFSKNEIGKLKLGNSVELIEEGAFAENKLNNLVLPASIKEIRGAAFENNQIKVITFLGSIPKIGRNAFRGSSFTSITIPASQEIPNEMFSFATEAQDFRHEYKKAGKAAGTYIKKGSTWFLNRN